MASRAATRPADRVVIWTRVTTRRRRRAVASTGWLEDDGDRPTPDRRDRRRGPIATGPCAIDVGGLRAGSPLPLWLRGDRRAFARSARTRTLPDRRRRLAIRFAPGLVRQVQRRLLQRLRPPGRTRRPRRRSSTSATRSTRPRTRRRTRQTPGADIGRPFDPLHECKTLDDYRPRYRQYRTDPDIQAAHAAHPFICTARRPRVRRWRMARRGRQPRRATRRARGAERKARRVPCPLGVAARPAARIPTTRAGSSAPSASGRLADLFLIDTRTRRDQPVAAARDAPTRVGRALGPEQKAWLFDELDGSTATWRLLGNPSVMARTWNDDLPEPVKTALRQGQAHRLRTAPGPTTTSGTAIRSSGDEVLARIGGAGPRNVVVLSGDVHVGMAIELAVHPGDEPPSRSSSSTRASPRRTSTTSSAGSR